VGCACGLRLWAAPAAALRERPRYVLTPDQEREVLAAWHAR
jgi:hypothetical protein